MKALRRLLVLCLVALNLATPASLQASPQSADARTPRQMAGHFIAGAMAGVAVWGALVLKDHYCGVVIPGGPEFWGLDGLPVTVLLAGTVTTAVAYWKGRSLFTVDHKTPKSYAADVGLDPKK